MLQAVSMVYIAAFLTAIPNLDARGFMFAPSQKSASLGAIVMIYVSGFGWTMDWNFIQYILNSEIYPLRIRTASSSLIMCWHFLMQYGNTRAVPEMLLVPARGGLRPAGTFWTFAAVTLLGLAWAWLSIPETAGLSLESMDGLFKLRWWQISRNVRALADPKSPPIAELERTQEKDEMAVENVEHVREVEKRL